MINRREGVIATGGHNLHAVLTIAQLLDHWGLNGKVAKGKIEETREFLKQTH